MAQAWLFSRHPATPCSLGSSWAPQNCSSAFYGSHTCSPVPSSLFPPSLLVTSPRILLFQCPLKYHRYSHPHTWPAFLSGYLFLFFTTTSNSFLPWWILILPSVTSFFRCVKRPIPILSTFLFFQLSLWQFSVGIDWINVGRSLGQVTEPGPEPAFCFLSRLHCWPLDDHFHLQASCQLREKRNKVYLAERIAVPLFRDASFPETTQVLPTFD